MRPRYTSRYIQELVFSRRSHGWSHRYDRKLHCYIKYEFIHRSVHLKNKRLVWKPGGFLTLSTSLLLHGLSDAVLHTHTHMHISIIACKLPVLSCISLQLKADDFVTLCELTITGDESPVESAVRVQLVAFGWSFAGRSLHEELVFVEGALLSAIQWLALRLERTPGLLSVRLPFTGNERGAVFGFSVRESPERVRLVIPTLRSRRAIIWIHRCHIAVWDARCVHT